MQFADRLRLSRVAAIAAGCTLAAVAGCCLLVSYATGAKQTNRPAEVDEVADGITAWTLPAGFAGDFAVTMDNILIRFDFAKFTQQEGRGILLIAQTQLKFPQQDQQEEMTQNLINQLSPGLRKIESKSSEVRVISIRGLPGHFQIDRGEDYASTTKMVQVFGKFRGKRDDVLMILQYEADVLSDQEIDGFLTSIK